MQQENHDLALSSMLLKVALLYDTQPDPKYVYSNVSPVNFSVLQVSRLQSCVKLEQSLVVFLTIFFLNCLL